MLSKIKRTVIEAYVNAINVRRSKAESLYDAKNLSNYMKDSEPLSNDEKDLIFQQWGKIIKCIKRGFPFYRGIKALDEFNASYVPSSYFFPYIEEILNPKEWKYHLSHKGITELIYGSGVRHPQTILRSYGGILLDSKFTPLLKDEIKTILSKINEPILFKPAIDTLQGSGIKLIYPKDFEVLIKDIETGNIFNQCKEFVLQVPVHQSKETSLFNPTSLNCMRITTINLNGNVSVGSRALKCGPKNSVVDNIGTGRRGVIVGINPNGTLKDFGYYGNGDIADQHNNVFFAGYKIDHFKEVEKAAKLLHSFVPNCKIIGWDIALDEDNNPVLIEGNTVYPGISVEQMCSGPIFGERTQEVVNYIIDSKRNTKGAAAMV